MRVAVYAGSFDPFTRGHQSVLRGALKAFPRVRVAIGRNRSKKGLFTPEERQDIVQRYADLMDMNAKIDVAIFDGLLTDFCKQTLDTQWDGELPESVVIVRGLRAVSDLEIEMQIADANRHLDDSFQTIFIPTEASLAFVSSSVVREIASYGVRDKLDHYLIPTVSDLVIQKMGIVLK